MGKNVYQYARFTKNLCRYTERAIELPFIIQEVRKYKYGKILEVGNVLNLYYKDLNHEVIDKYEKFKNVKNIDIMEFNTEIKYDLIVSISTLEHVGYDEKIKDPNKALNSVLKLINIGKKVIITIPLGYNKNFDKKLLELKNYSERYLMEKISEDRWIDYLSIYTDIYHTDFKYNYPFPYANWLLILVFESETA
jgi:hypothetical protein